MTVRSVPRAYHAWATPRPLSYEGRIASAIGTEITRKGLVRRRAAARGSGMPKPIKVNLSIGSFSGQQVFADDVFHDFVCAAVDSMNTGVNPRARDRIFAHVSVAAKELEAFVDHLV